MLNTLNTFEEIWSVEHIQKKRSSTLQLKINKNKLFGFEFEEKKPIVFCFCRNYLEKRKRFGFEEKNLQCKYSTNKNLQLAVILEELQLSGVQLSERLASLSIMVAQLRAPLKPLDTIMPLCSMGTKGP